MTAATEIREGLRQWIAEANQKISSQEIADDTPIVEQGILTSLQAMELLLFIEQLSGRPIEIEQLQPGSFKNINAIYTSFFGKQP